MDSANKNTILYASAALPDGKGGFEPCPELMTEDEAIRFLRLNNISTELPSNTLRYYKNKCLLRATQVGNAFAALYSQGMPGNDDGTTIQNLFRYFRQGV